MTTLIKQGKVDVSGKFNRKAASIHKIKPDGNDYYTIKTL